MGGNPPVLLRIALPFFILPLFSKSYNRVLCILSFVPPWVPLRVPSAGDGERRGILFGKCMASTPVGGGVPTPPAAAPHFSPNVRRIRSRHCREGACPFRQQTPRHAPPSGESANVLRIRRRAFYVVIGAVRKGQALSLQGSVCEFAIGGGIGKVLLRGVPGRHALQLSGCEFALDEIKPFGVCCAERRRRRSLPGGYGFSEAGI